MTSKVKVKLTILPEFYCFTWAIINFVNVPHLHTKYEVKFIRFGNIKIPQPCKWMIRIYRHWRTIRCAFRHRHVRQKKSWSNRFGDLKIKKKTVKFPKLQAKLKIYDIATWLKFHLPVPKWSPSMSSLLSSMHFTASVGRSVQSLFRGDARTEQRSVDEV